MSFSKNLNLELKRAQKKLSFNLLYVLNIIRINLNLNGSFLQQHRISVGPQEVVQSRLGRRDSTREESS